MISDVKNHGGLNANVFQPDIWGAKTKITKCCMWPQHSWYRADEYTQIVKMSLVSLKFLIQALNFLTNN